MKAAWSMMVVLAAALVLVVAVQADETKTLNGTITCAKCDLKKEKACTTVIVVKEDGKDVVYYFDETSGKKNHKTICQEPKKGTVTGTVSEKDGKKTVQVEKVKFD